MGFEKLPLHIVRKIANLTQKELATACGVSESTVANWETGRSEPTVSQAYKISAVVNRPIDSIIFLPPSTVKP